MSWKPEVQTDASGKWYGNALRFASKEEAEANVAGLMSRWMLVRATRVVESDDPVNYRFDTETGELIAIGPVLNAKPEPIGAAAPVKPYAFRGMLARAEMIHALREYAYSRVPLGDFLQAVLAGDLYDAVNRADDDNLANLPALAAFVWNELPRGCWGSRERYINWIARKEAF